MSEEPRLYGELAAWWPLVSAPEEYAWEGALYARLLHEGAHGEAPALLELGSGGGNNASHMKARFREVTLVDRSPAMLEVSRRLNPECHHVEGDMRSIRLGRTFDCILVHDAVCYLLTEEGLARTAETVHLHLRSGGSALFVPDYLRETFRPGTSQGGHDGPERALRYLAWRQTPAPGTTRYRVDYAYLLREADGSVRAVHDRHEEGLFPRRRWLAILEGAGFQVTRREIRYPGTDEAVEAFLCRRP